MFKVTILTLFCSFLAGPDTGELKVIIERNVPVPMRDGTILRADVHRPDRGGPYPVLVQRTPYGKESNFHQFVKAGYIVVSQDVRGRYESEGEWESLIRPKTHDGEDGYDTVEWAARLPGSTGKVGTFGGSYRGLLQWRLAPLRPPSLAAMSANAIAARHTYYRRNGAMLPDELGKWVISFSPEMRRRDNQPGVHTVWEMNRLWGNKGESKKWLGFFPRLALPDEVFEGETTIMKHYLQNPHLDPFRLDEGCSEITVPNLEFSSWYDMSNGDMLMHQTMAKEGKTETARKGSRTIIGPWRHLSSGSRYGNIDFGPVADLDRTAAEIRWFDYWLKGIQNGVDKDAPVRIFVMGDNEWRDEQHWPLQRAKDRIFYINSAGHANTPEGNGRLVEKEDTSPDTDTYTYDPSDPVPSPGGHRLIPADQRPLAQRKDILVYQTPPLTERLEVTGNPVVELYASSTAPDTDWFVRLIDVSPDGLAFNVAQGVICARYRNGLDKPELIRPGEIVKYTIAMMPTSNAFLPGHRIRLDITSSDYPNYDCNHNTAAGPNVDATLVTAEQTIHHGGDQATRIILPWIPNPTREEPAAETKAGSKPQKQIYPLHLAAADGDTEQIMLLLSQKVDVNAKDGEGRTSLHHAVKSGKKEAVQTLIKACANVKALDKDGVTPLHVAAEFGNKNVVELLVANGADINSKDIWIWSPLHYAAWKGHRDVAEVLIAEGAEVDAKDEYEFSPLYYAAQCGYKDVAELLIAKGADIYAKDRGGITPLGYALSWDNKEVAELFFAKMTDFSSKINHGLTALHTAAVHGYKDIAELLLRKGASVDERDENYEFTALHYAARFGNKDVAEVLIDHRANIRAKDKWGYQPIHWAAYHDRSDTIELLIAKGADVNAKTSLGQTPLELAIPRRNTKTIEVLQKYSNKNTTLDKPYVILEHGDVRAVIVNNEPVDDEVLPGHRGGYSGVASLTHQKQNKNLFVPFYAGLNFEHIHDGTVKPRDILFEPRRAPMQIRQIDEYTAEFYQPPTPYWQLESWLRYRLLEDGVIEMTLECIPRASTFKNNYIGLFFASYIDKPESLDIHFLGRPADQIDAKPQWIRGVTPEHGKFSTHLAIDDNRNFAHDPNFPLTLVFNKSNYRYTEPWYYGVSHGMALVPMFRLGDNVRFSQSPSGGGNGNPAWDFQWFVPEYKVGQRYRFVMRAMYLPFESRQQIIQASARNRAALER